MLHGRDAGLLGWKTMTTGATHSPWPDDLYDQIKAHGEFLSGRLGKLTRGKQLTLVGADLTGIKLVGMNLQRTVFRSCRFYCADLRNTDFSQAVLTGCDATPLQQASATARQRESLRTIEKTPRRAAISPPPVDSRRSGGSPDTPKTASGPGLLSNPSGSLRFQEP